MEEGSDDDGDGKSFSSGIMGREEVSVFITGVLKGREMARESDWVVEVVDFLIVFVVFNIGQREERWRVLSLTAETEPTSRLSKAGGMGV